MKKLLAELSENAKLPIDRAYSLPPQLYCSDAILELEVQKLFHREWICVGQAQEIPNPGDYLAYDIVDEPVFVVRQEDGSIRAFSNVCLHRCSRLLEGKGSRKLIVCPYHAWSYDSRGHLVGAPHMGETRKASTLKMHLHEMRCESWNGFVYVSLRDDITPINDHLKGLVDILASHQLEKYVNIIQEIDVWDTNWKCLAENFMESYHLFMVHPQTFEPDTPTRLVECLPGEETYNLHLCHCSPEARKNTSPERSKVLDEKYRYCSVLSCIYPSHLLAVSPDYMWYLSLQPVGADKVRVRWGVSVAPEVYREVQDREQFPNEQRAIYNRANAEDRLATERVRRGLGARSATSGPLSRLERPIYEFGQYLARQLCG